MGILVFADIVAGEGHKRQTPARGGGLGLALRLYLVLLAGAGSAISLRVMNHC